MRWEMVLQTHQHPAPEILNGVGPRCVLLLLAISRMSSHALPPILSSLPVLSSSSSGRIRTLGGAPHSRQDPARLGGAPIRSRTIVLLTWSSDPRRLGGAHSAAGTTCGLVVPHTCSRTTRRLGCSLHSQQV